MAVQEHLVKLNYMRSENETIEKKILSSRDIKIYVYIYKQMYKLLCEYS